LKIISDFNKAIKGEYAVALGIFDGLHIAHTAVIKNVCMTASSLIPAVFIFSDNFKGTDIILPEDMFLDYLEKIGIKTVFKYKFSDVKDLSPEEFVKDILIGKFNAKAVSCGFNYRFGKNGDGNCADLKKLCQNFNINCTVSDEVDIDGEPVSSTRIRSLLKEGNVETAQKLLGRPFCYDFTVEEGNKIGRLMDTPTINQYFPKDFCIPKYGVYASLVKIKNKIYYGVTNIGVKPTVGSSLPLSETWIADFDGDLYGKQVSVFLLKFIRPEKKFDSLDLLRSQILSDGVSAKNIAEEYLKCNDSSKL